MIIKLNFIAILLAVLLLSCNNSNKKSAAENSVQDVMLSPQKQEEQKAMPLALADSTGNAVTTLDNVLQAGQPKIIDWDKKIIKTANVTLELADYASYNQTIHNSTKRYGAYISAEQQTEQNGKLENNLSIKVPVDQFEALMNALPSQGVKVIEKRITTEDVTGEVVDTKARTEAKKQVRDRYLDLLKQAKNMKDILEVQNQINGIQEDIEAGAGRVDYLLHQAAYSTINLQYYQIITGANPTENTPSFFTKIAEAFKDGISIVTGFIVLIVTFWPLVLAGLLAWLFFKKMRIGRGVKA